LKFCEKCDSKLIETSIGLKCPKCDDLSQIPKKTTSENKIGTLSRDSFPFEKNLDYKAPNIRNALNCDKQSGISYNKNYNFLTLLRYAHKLEPNSSNPYLDEYKDGKYFYVGKGSTGNQTITSGVNEKLANSKQTGTKIHLFWQKYSNSDHQYVGEMNLEGQEPKTQPGKDGNDRTVYVFTLKSI
jgi:hypothetical protein